MKKYYEGKISCSSLILYCTVAKTQIVYHQGVNFTITDTAGAGRYC